MKKITFLLAVCFLVAACAPSKFIPVWENGGLLAKRTSTDDYNLHKDQSMLECESEQDKFKAELMTVPKEVKRVVRTICDSQSQDVTDVKKKSTEKNKFDRKIKAKFKSNELKASDKQRSKRKKKSSKRKITQSSSSEQCRDVMEVMNQSDIDRAVAFNRQASAKAESRQKAGLSVCMRLKGWHLRQKINPAWIEYNRES